MTSQKKPHDENPTGGHDSPEKQKDHPTKEGHGKDKPIEAEKKTAQQEQEESQETKYLRLMADFQNYKRRSEKERAEIHAFANEKIVAQLLEVLDNFDRAMQQEAGTQTQFRDGMSLILDQLKTVLSKAGVTEIDAEGAEFDPNFHHAIIMENHDSIKSGHVSMVLQKGYTLNGKVIRPAIVKVAE